MKNISTILSETNLLAGLAQKDNFVGWVYRLDYTTALVMTNDLWKARVFGVPHNCFLVATAFDPDQYQDSDESAREVTLLRVTGSARLPQDDELVQAKIDNFQQQQQQQRPGGPDFDDITQNQLQFGGLECRVLGTFFIRDKELRLGSDLESFAAATRLTVYRPRGEALALVVNHVDPVRKAAARNEAQQLGLTGEVQPFKVGTVRYTSTDRLHRPSPAEAVPVFVQPSDFLARRTAVLGMTRTGKSNMVKQMVSVVKQVADGNEVKIGQIIYDINGEYANANQQDRGSIADIFADQTVRYRMLKADGFEMLQNNFFLQVREGFDTIRRVLSERRNDTGGDVQVFLNTSFDEPDPLDKSSHNRWRVRTAAYQCMLHLAGFKVPDRDGQGQPFLIRFEANKEVRKLVTEADGPDLDPSKGMHPEVAVEWFLSAREADRRLPEPPEGSRSARGQGQRVERLRLPSSSGKPWLDDDTVAILNMMANKNANDAYIRGYKVLFDAREYHSPLRGQEVGDEIYKHLRDGKIVILDLSVGDPILRERVGQQIAQDIFSKSMRHFVEGRVPPNIVVYVEEAHNLIGKDAKLTDTWPRLAKEGAKYRVGLVYATQEVSSVHPNILANTENWFVTHLNNEREIKELARFYDFADFGTSLMRAQDVGFARVKTLSSPFVVPVQIDKFDPVLGLAGRPRAAAASVSPSPRLGMMFPEPDETDDPF